jgi:hypothetical protein
MVKGSNRKLRIPTAISTAQATVFTVSMKPPSFRGPGVSDGMRGKSGGWARAA